MSPFDFWGHDRNGRSRTGCCDISVRVFVEDCYRQCWRDLRAEREGIEVGYIGVNPHSGNRVWWVDPDETVVP